MRLRPALMTCVIAALVIVTLRLTTVALERQASAHNDRQRETVEVIARDAANLLVLTQDYGLHRSDRAARQWALVHERLTRALHDYAAAGAESAAQVDDLQDTARTLPGVFDALRATGPNDADALDLREMLADQLVNETRRVSDGAFDLADDLARLRALEAERQRWLAVGAHVLVLALTLALAWLLHRRVLGPIDRLREVARAVEGGDLSARSRLPGGDELGQLSLALDTMTGALQQRDTALRDSNRLLSRSEAFLARAGKMARVGGWELEIPSEHLSWSGETRALLGLPERHVVDIEAMLGCFAPESARRLRQALALARTTGEGWDLELQLPPRPGRDGAPRWLHAVGAAELENGRAVRLVGAVQDVTERCAAADALRHALQAADSANAAKTRFLANMSHEIRTPMNAVLGLNDLLERSALAPAQRELVGKIGSAGRALLDILNGVLDLSKIEAGEMALEAAPFDPQSLLRDVTALFTGQAAAKGITLNLALAPDLPALLMGDGARLRQIVANLASNAIKFTGEGDVRITARSRDASARSVQLEIAVEDSGIGIPADALSRLFTPFTQADSSTSRRYGGTGLGLAIVKQLCELMGGQVDVSSSPGAGTRFVIRLPFEPATGVALPTRPLTLLLATDDGVQREALQRLCADLGWQAEPVTDAAALQARLDGAPPDLLLLDHRLLLPLDTTARAALQTRLTPLPCVPMSRASTAPSAAGLRLPADVSSLFDAVHAALAERGASGSLLASARGAAAVKLLPGVRVLVTDDSAINLEVAQRILEDEGAEVTLAHDGALAIAALRDAPDGFDAVLMDVQMPVLDGLAAARRIRTELGLQELPILALTAGALLSERQRALEAGMNDSVSKPFDPSGLVLLLRQHIERARGQRLPVAARTTEAPAQDDPWPLLDGIARDEARQRLQGDVDFFARLLERLLDEFTDLAAVPEPLPSAPAAAARLHKLAGSAGLMAAGPLRDAARRGEAKARAGEAFDVDLAEVARLLSALAAQARPWLQRLQADRQRAAPPPAEPLDQALLAGLRQALRSHDPAALDLFGQLAPALRAARDEEQFTMLREAVERLDFAAALAQLDA